MYLHSASSNSNNVQIDYHRKWVSFTPVGGHKVDTYKIETASPAVLHGYNLGLANYSGGQFAMTSTSEWVWSKVGSSSITFKESHRDEWSVYLRSDKHKLNVQIDFHRTWIVFSGATGVDFFKITSGSYRRFY